MSNRITALTFLLWFVLAVPVTYQEELVSVEGVVVAIQRGKDDTRIVDPNSMGDLAEIYLVRADHWSQPHKEKYIVVEYIHRADLIGYDQFDKTLWKFEVHQASPGESKNCFSWMARGPSFLSTAFGAKVKLPDPKTLTCFLMTKRPVPVPPTPTTH